MILRARTVLPVGSPPLDNGAVWIEGGHIRRVGPWPQRDASPDEPVIDLGDMVLLPGLINTHCHLDYTDMAGRLSPAKHFSDWIKAIVALKSEWSYTDYASSWLNGADMLLRSGTTTVVDIEAVPELLTDMPASTPLRVISCLELLALRSPRGATTLVQEAAARLSEARLFAPGFSPHAPYSTSAELLRAAAVSARQRHWLLTTHVAESADESEMFQRGSGAMFDWLKHQRDMTDCDGRSPVRHLALNDVLGHNFLAVHANYLAPGDAELLARSGSRVVHCPRSHAFFGHHAFPLAELERAGVNVCLGTDSLATVTRSRTEPPRLSLLAEMRALASVAPGLAPPHILEMATIRAARALGCAGELGVLAPGARADLIALPFTGDVTNVHEAVLNHRGEVSASMIGGQWAIAPSDL